jgi:c-di-GMP-related signal transduction protein
MIQRLKIANETRLKLLNKYLPDLKQVEAEINADVGLTVKVVKYGSQDSE